MVVIGNINMCAASSRGLHTSPAGMVHYIIVVLVIAFEMFLSRTMYIRILLWCRAYKGFWCEFPGLLSRYGFRIAKVLVPRRFLAFPGDRAKFM
jgi:hypothetical protein